MKEIPLDQPNPSAEFGSQAADVNAFNDIVGEVEKHNAQFSLGAMLARTIVDRVAIGQKAESLIAEGANPEEAEETAEFIGIDRMPVEEEQLMMRELLGITNGSVLDAAGLAISPLRKDFTVFGNVGMQSVGKVRLRIADGGKFSGFLFAVKEDAVTDILQGNIRSTVQGTVQEVEEAVLTEPDNPMISETLAYAEGISAGLERLGIKSPEAERLKVLATHATQGDIREYVKADKLQLLTKPEDQAFGPAQWQQDATGEYLNKRWGEILSTIKEAQANPKASELSSQLLAAARTSLDYAKADWTALKQAEPYATQGEYGKDFEGIFEAVGLELDLLSSPDEEK